MSNLLPQNILTHEEIIARAKNLSLSTAVLLIDGDYADHCSLPVVQDIRIGDQITKGVQLIVINCEYGMVRLAAIGSSLAEVAVGRKTSWFSTRFDASAHVYTMMMSVRHGLSG